MNISPSGLLSVGVLAGLVVLVSFPTHAGTKPVVVNVVPSTTAQFVPVQPGSTATRAHRSA